MEHEHHHSNHQPSGGAALKGDAVKEGGHAHHRPEQQGRATEVAMHDKHAGHHSTLR